MAPLVTISLVKRETENEKNVQWLGVVMATKYSTYDTKGANLPSFFPFFFFKLVFRGKLRKVLCE